MLSGYCFDYYDENTYPRYFPKSDRMELLKLLIVFIFGNGYEYRERGKAASKVGKLSCFLSSSEYYENKLPIKVLFILGNISDKSGRKYALREYIDRNLRGEISDEFNLFVGIPEDLLKIFSSEESPLPKIFRKRGSLSKKRGAYQTIFRNLIT